MVIIPAKNEAGTIAEIVGRVAALDLSVLVVDDASCDSTGAIAAEAGATVLTLEQPHGNLRAIQAGLRYALAQGAQVLVTLDADGQHFPEDLPNLLRSSRGEAKYLIIGSCTARGSRLRHWAWKFFRLLSGLTIDDLTSGYKVYSRAAAEKLAGRSHWLLGYQDLPTLLMFEINGFKIKEVPVHMAPRRPGTGISRVFSSWGKVLVYMTRITTICLAHRPHRAAHKLGQMIFHRPTLANLENDTPAPPPINSTTAQDDSPFQ